MADNIGGGSVRIIWDETDTASVTITGASFTVDGTPVTFPYTLTDDTTFVTTKDASVSISVLHHGIEIAGPKAALLTGNGQLIMAVGPVLGSTLVSSILSAAAVPVTATTTQLADIAHAINTTAKATGKEVFNTTTSKPVWAVGATAGSVWKLADGTTAHTPA